ncbi:hypothetical protein ES708_00054 [subsurface metagenome]
MAIRIVNPNDIKFEKDCYPRSGEIDNQYLDLLQLADWNALPPILVNEDLILVDGLHRLTLAKMRNLSQIKVKQRNIPKEKILEEAVRLNAKFGMQLSQSDKRRVAQKLFQDGTHKVSSLAKLLSVTTRFVNKWTSDIRTEREKTRNEKILDLYLVGWTEAEIGKKCNLHKTTVGRILNELQKGINSETLPPDLPQIGDVWLFSSCDDAYGISGFPGRIPGQIVENLLHFYTKPFDKVIDPMAGSGTTMDVCKAMYRRCLTFDLKPMKENIALHNVRDGFPPRARRCDFIILDPPYYRKKDESYHPESISSLPHQEYLAAFAKLAHDSYRILNKGGHLALVMSNYLDEENPRGSVWLWDYIELFRKAKFTPIRELQCPLSTQSLHPGHVEQFRKARLMAKLTRSIVVFEK